MRVSSVGWLFDTLEDTRKLAKLSAEVTHNHPEGIKGAEATASAIFMARNGASKDEIKEYIIREFDLRIFPEPAMRSDRDIIMLNPVRRPFLRQLRHFWKEMILRM